VSIIDTDLLRQILPGLDLSEDSLDLMERYAQRLLETNENMNLTAITDPRGVTLKHFADSLSLLCVHEFPQRGVMPGKGAYSGEGTPCSLKVLDLGTGGGFPGVPLLLARPDVCMTFLDSTRKKLRFIASALEELNVPARFLHARAEDAGNLNSPERGKYDVVTARAVAALPVLCGYALPFLRKDGVFFAMKGLAAREETVAAQPILCELGARLVDCIRVALPEDCGERWIVVVRR
jgi:16S rRNA (guanine527-N7)-methyltransferase